MKRRFFLYLIGAAAGISSAISVQGQDTTTIGQDLKNAGKKTGKVVGKSARKVGNKTAEIASKGKSEVIDKVYDGKEGPEGEKIYIDGKSRYYYVDQKGHKQYVKERKLRDKKS